MEFSLPAWLGGLAGTIVAVALYVPAIRIVERRLRAQDAAADARAARRIRGQDLGHAAGDFRRRHRDPRHAGYWIGNAIGGKWRLGHERLI